MIRSAEYDIFCSGNGAFASTGAAAAAAVVARGTVGMDAAREAALLTVVDSAMLVFAFSVTAAAETVLGVVIA